MIRVGVLGARGRMGTQVCRLLQSEFVETALLAAQVNSGNPMTPLLGCDSVIEFSSPAAASDLANQALEFLRAGSGRLPAFVFASTGWTPDQLKRVEALAQKTPVLLSSNFSAGVFALTEILKNKASVLQKLGYKAEIVETHHQHKKDAPSGTALHLGQALAGATAPGSEKAPIQSIRSGEVIGDHTITFRGPGDWVQLTHSALDRSIFARGAIECAIWLASKRDVPGWTGKTIGSDAYFKERTS